jgi:hypothetical protein
MMSETNDVFEFAKKNKITVQVEYIESVDLYKVLLIGNRDAMDITLDGLIMESHPGFRKRALDHCLEQYIARRR